MSRALLRNPVTIGIFALVALIIIASTFTIVRETQQDVVVRFEQPIRIINPWKPNQIRQSGAGLIARIPFADGSYGSTSASATST